MRIRPVALCALAVVWVTTSCGASSGGAATVTTSSIPAVSSTSSSTSVAPTTAAPTTTSTTSSSSTTSAVLPDVRDLRVPIPKGQLRAAPGDVLAVHADGDLWLHRGLLTATPGSAEQLVGLADPRVRSAEGPGANRIDRVAGPIDGVVYFTDCCEPVSGNLYAVGQAGAERRLLAPGDRVALRHDAGAIAMVNSYALSVIELPSGRQSTEVFAAPISQLGGGWDVLWARDGRSLLVLDAASDWFDILRFDAVAPFALLERVRIATPGRPPSGSVLFAGRGPNGEIAVAVEGTDRTSVRFFDADTLAARPELEQRLPAGATAVQLAGDGRGVLWITGEALWHRAADGSERRLGDGFAAAWFIDG